jgi:lipoic acid synthetase
MSEGTATFLILGDTCTRRCGFCAVRKCEEEKVSGDADYSEAERVALGVQALKLKHAVITSVTRDDLSDGGALLFALTIRKIRELSPKTSVEVLVPDFCGSADALEAVLREEPDVLNHNVETVKRLYPSVRPQADYGRSLALLRRAKTRFPSVLTKSGLMVGLGEEWEEIWRTLEDLREASCDLLTVGQYLCPSKASLPVTKYYHPDEFHAIRRGGEAAGFLAVASGPLVRSSHHAAEMISVARL